jgi:PIN domain nuclease of toxin-antitoxin system
MEGRDGQGVGRGLGRAVTATYLDTNVAVWLAQNSLDRLSMRAIEHLRGPGTERLLSPAVMLELQFLYELKRILLPPADIQRKLEYEFGVRVCNLDFSSIVMTALDEVWTRDPFDRLITAHARANGLAWLVTADRRIREYYLRAIW